ncbi:AMP-dependent synthetase/ligase [Sulfidibacter corallicola]|uniref:Long-chain fatty acid--CoA ligase n=1 Tax=Sulfidibacter corallicola TaxID=2818388 RepID=A0A8A4TQA7_SULCO|nr:long-chain fatty acid--CoA ligase [Sulfidibacter corallicola]QTD48735.1 long-chain fatty acid--CoA ligase [Sulfidibacter corallicola]
MFFETCEKYKKPDAVMVKRDGAFQPVSHKAWRDRVIHFGRGLMTLGVQAKDHVAILAESSFDWTVADLGIISSGAVDVPIYPTLTGEQAAWILNNSDSIGLIVSNRAQAEKINVVRGHLPMIRFIIVMDGDCPEGTMSMAEVEEKGRTADNEVDYNKRWTHIQSDQLLTIVYTSGTTGNPKGVMLSHDNLISNIMSCIQICPFGAEDIHLSHLPLSHVLERMGGYYLTLYAGTTIAFAESIETLSDDMRDVRPTVLFSVPRLFEKIYTRVITGARDAGLPKRMIFRWAMGVGKKAVPKLTQGQQPEGFLAKRWKLADKLVYEKIRERTGGRLKYMIAGGAKLSAEIAEMFIGMGMTIVEGYGLTETSPVLTINLPEHNKPGSVGPPVPDVELVIAGDGEILARGPNVMMGYYKNPEATQEAIRDGWIYTGDIGHMDEEGFITVTDRKKDLIITSGGKNIAPQPLENALKLSPFIEQAVIVGNDRNFIAALIVPPWETIQDWARSFGWSTEPEKLVGEEEFRDFLANEITDKMKHFAKYEQVKKFEILTRPFTLETGELTPSMKVKRKVVAEKFKKEIEGLYV